MVFRSPDRLRLAYISYKKSGIKVKAELDPDKLLNPLPYSDALRLIPGLVRQLPKNKRGPVYDLVEAVIAGREECTRYYEIELGAGDLGHRKCINFWKVVKEQLGMYINNPEGLTVIKEQDRVVDDIEQDLVRGVKEQQLEEEEKEEEKEEEELPYVKAAQGDDNTAAEDDKTTLTLDQVDFLDLVEKLVGLVKKAAAFWLEEAQGKISNLVASLLSNIILREADSLINVARMLNEESWASEHLAPWAPATRPQRGGVSKPQLTQGWVDALDEASDVGARWREMTNPMSSFWLFLGLFVHPRTTVSASVSRSSPLMPYFLTMIIDGWEPRLDTTRAPTSAEVPLSTVIGVYFCSLAVEGRSVEEMTRQVQTTRNAVCATLAENMAILPRLITDGAFTEEQVKTFEMANVTALVRACGDPMSLGQIHFYARMQWVDWHARLIASNSLPLQVFLYLCEKRRLQAPETQDAEYERLLGAMMEDPRIAPALLMNGRPTTVAQCDQALQQWCCTQTEVDETLESGERWVEKLIRRCQMNVHSVQVRNIGLVAMQLATNHYGLTKDIRNRVSAREGNDDKALERYLEWEASAPNCLKIEVALLEAVQQAPTWGEMLATSISLWLPFESKWLEAVRNVINQGLRTLSHEPGQPLIVRRYEVSRTLQIAILQLALGDENTLKSTFADVFRPLIAQWQDSSADELLQATMRGWRKTFRRFQIDTLSRDWKVKAQACIFCFLPPREGNTKRQKETENPRRNQNNTLRSKVEEQSQNERVGDILKDFLDKSRLLLEVTYGQSPRTTLSDLEGLTIP